MKNRILIVMAIVWAVFLFSCQREDNSISKVMDHDKNVISTYFIDDVPVSKDKFEYLSANMLLVEFNKKDSGGANGEIVERRAYSTEEKYIAFGEQYGLAFEKQLVFEKMMSNYAETSGAVEEFEKTGKVPEWYLKREEFVYDSLFLNKVKQNAAKLNLFTVLYENFFIQGSGAVGNSVIMARTLAFMYPGWNDDVSCVDFVGVAGFLVIYDKTFYRKKLGTVVNWGLHHINLSPGLNDKMSSGILVF